MIRPQYHFRKAGNDTHIWNVIPLLSQMENTAEETLRLSDIREIETPYWFEPTNDVPTCKAVMEHAKQSLATDLSYPILICPNGKVIDGMHRVMKAWATDQKTIQAKRLTTLPPPDYINKRPDELPY